MSWRYRSLTWRYNVGIVLMGIPALCLVTMLLFAFYYAAYLFITGQDIPQSKPGYGRLGVYSSRIDTKIIGDEYFLKEWNSDDFKKVKKKYFHSVVVRENAQIRKTYIFSFGMLSFTVGLLLLKSLENQNFGSRLKFDAKEMLSLKALAKEKGIPFDGST